MHLVCVELQITVAVLVFIFGKIRWTGSSIVMSALNIFIEILRWTLDPLSPGQVSLTENRHPLPCLTGRGLKQEIRCLQNCSRAWENKLQMELPKMISKSRQNNPGLVSVELIQMYFYRPTLLKRMGEDLTFVVNNAIFRWCLIELYTWNLYNFINQCHLNTFNKNAYVVLKTNKQNKNNCILDWTYWIEKCFFRQCPY